MIALGTCWSDGVETAIKEFDLPWTCNRLGVRGENMFGKSAPVTGADVDAHTHTFRAMCQELVQ